MSWKKETAALNIQPVQDIPRGRFVNWSWGLAGDGDDVLGICSEGAEAGDTASLTVGGIASVTAGASLDGRIIQFRSDAEGRAVPCRPGDRVQAVLYPGQGPRQIGSLVAVYFWPQYPSLNP